MRKDYEEFHRRHARAFEGFETWLHARLMALKMYFYVSILVAVIFWIIWATIWWIRLPGLVKTNAAAWLSAKWYQFFWPMKTVQYWDAEGKIYRAPAMSVARAFGPFFVQRLSKGFKYGLIFFLPLEGWALFWAYRRFRRKAESEIHHVEVIRGPRMVEPQELMEMVHRKYPPSEKDLKLTCQVSLPRKLENRHGFVIGTQGSGKTMLLTRELLQLRERQEKAVIFDLKNEYVELFFDPTQDLIFNPLDLRCIKWRLFNELTSRKDAVDLATSIIPKPESGEGVEGFFRDAARDVLASILEIFLAEGGAQNDQIAGTIFAPLSYIANFLKSHPAGAKGLSYIEKTDSNQAIGVKATLMQFCRVFEWLQGLDGEFSLRQWIREDGPGFLFLSVPIVHRELLAPIVTAVVDLLIKEILDLPNDLSRRRWVFIDELGALYKINRIIDGLTLGRSKGLCMWLGTQDFGRLDVIYGRALRETIWNNVLTKIVLRVSAPETADYLSRTIGESEIESTERTSTSMGPDDDRDGLSFSRQDALKRLVLPSEIQNLPDLEAIIELGEFPPTKDRVEITPLKPLAEGFLPREEPAPPQTPKTSAKDKKDEDKKQTEENQDQASLTKDQEIDLY